MFKLILTHHRRLTHHRYSLIVSDSSSSSHSSSSLLYFRTSFAYSSLGQFLLHNQITLIFIHSAKSQSFEFTPFHYTPKLFHAHSIQTLSQKLTPLPYLLFEITIIDYFIHHKSQTTKMNSGDGSVLSLRSFSDILILHLNKGVSPWACLITTELKLEHVAWFNLSYKTPHPDKSFAYCSHHRFRLSNVTHLPTTTRHNLNLLDSAILH